MTDSSSKLENEIQSQLDYEDEEEYVGDTEYNVYSTNYRLVGIVVHSGQANGGHYYSFIKNRCEQDGSISNEVDSSAKWFKFDDNDVSEFKMDDEELRNQCYGGDYTGEVYDNVMKRMAYKKQKRWWNAYILFYERIKIKDLIEKSDSKASTPRLNTPYNQLSKTETITSENNDKHIINVKMPPYVLKSVLKKNIRFLHQRNHFSPEYFYFIKKLIQANLFYCQTETNVNLGSIQVFVLILFI
jgi:ubiquitin carboxyl-terminal hydrolase 9/24